MIVDSSALLAILLSEPDASLPFSPRSEAKCVRGPSGQGASRLARAGVLEGNHPAALNFGDCFGYALAKETGEPLLFKGEDFAQNDIEAA